MANTAKQVEETPRQDATTSPGASEGRDVGRSLRSFIGRAPWILWVLIFICAAFAVAEPDAFATVSNAQNISVDVSTLLVLAVGATFVLVAGGIDLSIGSVLVFASVIAARVLGDADLTGWLAIGVALVIALGCGLAWGILNGLVVAYLKVNALIATLGTMGMALGLAYVLSDGGLDIPVPGSEMTELATGKFAGLPYLALFALVVALVGGIILQQTRFGRHTAGIGSNLEAAERVGINVPRHQVKVYALSGLLSGLAGFMSLVRFSTTTIDGHSLDILDVITGVVLGGTSLFGGIGTMVGTVIGMLIPAVLQNGFIIVGILPFWQKVAVGAVLIAAVYIDQIRRSRQ
jgi:ribose transport system permease protein